MSSKAKKTILIAVAAVCILVCVGSGLFLYQYYHGVQVESTLLERMKTGTAEISSAPAPSDQPEQPEQDSDETPEESETDAAPSEEEPLMKTVRLPVDFAQLPKRRISTPGSSCRTPGSTIRSFSARARICSITATTPTGSITCAARCSRRAPTTAAISILR